ncbi:adventurous gliding motility protein AgmC [Pyxidicoccus trucidator]|uniref:adventurous gliding motility protein AgmC n=1 Tax=Pyxidicoccus trucidator TaxID=2709662 RepID=UPI0013D962C5|nr:Ig-like domain-containing protein [Pyxidicoccus trucidator]
MRASIAKALLLGGVLLAATASADPDEFGLGTGSVPLLVSAPNTVINKYAQLESMAVVGGTSVLEVETVQTGAGNKPSDRFPQNSLVMVIQMGAAKPGTGSDSAVSLDSGGIGRWELARVTAVRDDPHNDLTLDRQLVNTYPPAWTQVVHVPQYSAVTVEDGASLVAGTWNHGDKMGGVLAFLAQGVVTLDLTGKISADGKGFLGAPGETDGASSPLTCLSSAAGSLAARRGEGVYIDDFAATSRGTANMANGGGGGVCVRAGGGGGANGGFGGRGGDADTAGAGLGGLGGAPLNSAVLSDRLTLGGGGGAGHGRTASGGSGAAGGGIIFIRAGSLSMATQATLSASGATPAPTAQGAGGGGGGGTIHLRLGGASTCNVIEARGGAGGNNTNSAVAPGGGGGGGRVFFQASSTTCNPSAVAGLAGTTSTGGHFGAEPTAATVGSRSGPALFLPQKYEVPPAPVVTQPVDGSRIAQPLPVFKGTTIPFAQVHLFVDGSRATPPNAPVSADSSGVFTFTYAGTPLAGQHTVSAEALHLGAKSVRSVDTTFTVDTAAPTLTISSSPADPSRTTTATFVFSSNETGPGTRFECQLDGLYPFKLCDSPWVFTAADRSTPYTARIRAYDAAGNHDEESHSWSVDSTPPTRPVIGAPSEGALVGTDRPTFSGTVPTFETGLTVSLFFDNSPTAAETNIPVTTGANGTGIWSRQVSVANALDSAPHVVVALVRDTAGNESPLSAIRSFVVDTNDPAAPSILAPTGQFVSSTTFTVEGTAEAGSLVTVTVTTPNAQQQTVTLDTETDEADASGVWSVSMNIADALSVDGAILTLKANARDDADPVNVSVDATATFTLDLLGPTVTIDTRPDDPTNVNVAVFTFHASQGDSVFGCGFDPEGPFSPCVSPHAVEVTEEEEHEFCVQATDPAGHPSASAACYQWELDKQGPPAPVVLTPDEDDPPTQDVRPLFSGTAVAGSIIHLYVDGMPESSDPAVVVATGGNGDWTARPATALGPGFHVLTVTATEPAGNVSEFSQARGFTVDTQAPDAPVILAPTPGQALDTATPVFSGTAEPGAAVVVSVDGSGTPLGEAVANAWGAWTFTTPAADDLDDGPHSVTARARDRSGRPGPASEALSFSVDTVNPVVPTFNLPPARTNDSTPLITGGAERGTTVTVFIDNVQVGTDIADPTTGNWDVTPVVQISDGTHRATAMVRDAAGRPSPLSQAREFVVDTTAPGKPVITVPAADTYVVVVRPRIAGRAEALATVTIEVDGVFVGTAQANAGGDWNLAATTVDLAPGPRTVTAFATDGEGNIGAHSDPPIRFTVDAVAPAAPVVLSPASGSYVATTSPTVSGTAEAGSTVTVFIRGVAAGTTTAVGGSWSLRVAGPLAQESYTVSAQATDRAGNSAPSSVSAAHSFTVDTEAPDTQLISGPPLVSSSTTATFVVRARNSVTQAVDGSVVEFQVSPDGRPFIRCVLPTPVGSDCVMARNPAPQDDTFSLTLEDFAIRQEHSVLISARDLAGNQDPTPASYAWRVVDGRLTIGIKFGPDPITNDNTSTFVFESERPGAIFTGSVGTTDGGVPENFRVESGQDTITFPIPDGGAPDGGGAVLADGEYELTVRAENPDNSADVTSYTNRRWTIDTQKPARPTLTVDGRLVGSTVRVNTSNPTFRGMAERNGTVLLFNNIKVGETVVDGQGQWSLLLPTGLAQGTYTFTAQVRDPATNTSDPATSPTFVIDTDKPTVGVVEHPPAQTNSQTARFTFSKSEDVEAFECSVDNAPFAVCGSNDNPTAQFDNLLEGQHNLALRARDLAGNETASVVNYPWRVDRTPPVVTLSVKPPEHSGSADARFEFSADEPLVTFQCAIDASNFDECSQRVERTGLEDRSYVIRVTARDAAGNTSLDPVEYQWTVDTRRPDVPVLESPRAGLSVGSRNPLFRGLAEPNSTVTVLVDGDPVASTQVTSSLGQWEVASQVALDETDHTVRLVTVDRANNSSDRSEEVGFFVDVTGPNTVIESGPESRIRSTSATFTFSSEEGATFECSLNRGAYDACPPDGVFSGLEEGGQSLEVRAKDAAGNPDPSPATYSWRVYLGSDIRTRGGGLSCSSTEGGSGASLALLGLGGLVLLGARRRRQ